MKNGRFLSRLILYGGWALAIASFGYSAGNVINNKVNANELALLADKVNAAITTNVLQDATIKAINENLAEINKKLDKLIGWR